jgi:hypothetical protein
MLEREAYVSRRRKALSVENRLKPTVLSMIIGKLLVMSDCSCVHFQ